MTHLFLKYTLFLYITLRLAASANLFVDANLKTKTGNAYPSLEQAISAAMNGDPENTITLKASCIGKIQRFPQLEKNITGTREGSSLKIVFENVPESFDNVAVCSRLPILVLGDDSCLTFANFGSLSITGLNIQSTKNACINTISSLETLSFSSFCFNNTDPSLSSTTSSTLVIDGITTLSMINGIYIYDAAKQVTIRQAKHVILDKIILVVLATTLDSENSAFSISNSYFASSILTVSNFQVLCEPVALVMPSIIGALNIEQVWISKFDIPNCNFNGPAKTNPAIVSVSAASTLVVQEVFLARMTFGLFSQSMFAVSSVLNATFTNFYISNLYSPLTGKNPAQVISFNDLAFTNFSSQQYSATFDRWYLANCTFAANSLLINGSFQSIHHLGNVVIDNFNLTDTTLNQSYLFILQTQGAGSGTTDYDIKRISMKNINVTNATFRHSEMVNVDILNPKFIAAIENAHLEVSNLRLTNSNLSRAAIIHAEGFCTHISQVTAEDVAFRASSNFYVSNTIVSTVLISNTSVKTALIEDYSTFAVGNITNARLMGLDKSLDAEVGVYAETRPFLVYNCSFDSIQILSHSYLIASTNPMVIVQRNQFANISVNNAVLIQLGNYLLFLSLESYIYEDTITRYPNNYTILPYYYGENAIFQNLSELGEVYNNSRATISAYDRDNWVFFMWVNENNITNITVNDSSNLIELYNFEVSNGTLAVVNNSFMSTSANRGINLVYCFYIKRGIFAHNSFSSMNLAGYAFLFISASIHDLILDSNHISQTQQLAMHSITSNACLRIKISNLTALNVEMELTFIDISCVAIGKKITIQGSTFENIFQTNTPKPIMYPLDLISSLKFISVKESNLFFDRKGTPQLVFQNNSFYNSTIRDTQGYTQGLFQSSLLSMVSFKAKLILRNNSFNNIVTLPKGNIMTLSTPRIEFANSTFYNFSFGGAYGAIHAIFESLSVKNCTFSGIKSLDSDGVGIFKLTNPSPQDVGLRVDIQNTTFRDSSAPYSAVLEVKESALVLNISETIFSNNEIWETETGSILSIQNTSGSNISIVNSSFSHQQGHLSDLQNLKMIAVKGSGPQVSVNMSDLVMDVSGNTKGAFISISGQHPVTLLGTRISYAFSGSADSSSQFGLFEGDNFNATFTRIQVNNISLGQTGLFTINANTASRKNSGEWRLSLLDSSFNDMKLSEGLIVITSDNYSPTPLDNLSVILENISISQVDWLGTSNGIVSSSTYRLGRSHNGAEFAIVFNNCSFVNLRGSTGLIMSSTELIFDSVALITNCRFSTIKASGPGAILNPSIRSFSNDTRSILHHHNSSRAPAFKIIKSSFENISSSHGTIIRWISTQRGHFLYSEDNLFAKIKCSGNGGLVYAQYQPKDSSKVSPIPFHVFSRNDTVVSISGTQNGGVIYAEGATELFNITFSKMTLSDIQCSGDGGVAYLLSPKSHRSTEAYSLASSRLLATPEKTPKGIISILHSNFSNIVAENGGIIYENTQNNSLELYFESNTLDGVYTRTRGGAFYFVKPFISITNNYFLNVFANIAGPIIYSVSDEIDLTNFLLENYFAKDRQTLLLEEIFSGAPTNLLVNFTPIHGGQLIEPEDKSSLLNPTFQNLTSYSLSEYQISLTLVSNGTRGLQKVHDESNDALVTLVFVPMRGEPKTFVSKNCSKSTCTVIADTVPLQGYAGDVILVNATYNSSVYTQFQQFYIQLRSCLPGEINITKTYECLYCPAGTYSLNPKNATCLECPVGANCNGGSNITVKEGFYKSNISYTSLHMVPCNDSGSRCKGNNFCSQQFCGPVCLQCNLEKGYFMHAQSGTCVLCAKREILITMAVFLLIGSIIYQIIMTAITYKENKHVHAQYRENRRRNLIRPGQFLVIFSTYTQIISIVANIDEEAIRSLIRAVSTVGNPNTHVVFSLQCLYLLHSPEPFKALEFRVLVYILSPLVKVLIAVVFECFRNLIWKDHEGLGRKKSLVRVGALAVVLILLEQPGIVGVLSKYLTCSKLDPYMNVYYIKTHNSIQCYTPQYNFFKHVVVLPALICWAFLVPLVIFMILFKIRRRLFVSESLRIIFGSLYNSYYESSYYWGVLIIIFKVTIYVLNAVLTTSPIFKGVIFMWLIQLYFYFLKKRSPYPSKYLFMAESLCCVAYLITLTLVFVRLSTDSEEIKHACSAFIFITISIAGLYILLNVFSLYFLKLGDFIRAMKERRKLNHMKSKALKLLKAYHETRPSHIDRHHRRGAICVEVPEE